MRHIRLGAHVSIAGGVFHAPERAAEIHATAFAMDIKNKRRWNSPKLDQDAVDLFKLCCKEHGFDPAKDIVPHGSYLMNLGSPDKEALEKSRNCLLDELERCERLGIGVLNFHPGSSLGKCTAEECCATVAESINWAVEQTKEFKVVLVVENTAGQGNVVGKNLQELRWILDRVENKARIGFCIDTAHLFASGVDIRTTLQFSDFLDEFDQTIGLKYLRAMHLNDSKAKLGTRRDLHENIGNGEIGLECFRAIMKETRLKGIPLILETPESESGWSSEIDLLFKLVN
jgi:apurinic endonuclease APN1